MNQPPECYGTWFESDQLPWSDAHPDRRAFVVFRDYPGSWSDSNEQPDFKESGSSPTSPPRRTYSSLESVSAETTFYWACHFRFSLAGKFPFLEIENPIAETQGAEDEMLPSRLAKFLRQDAEWRFPARA